MIINRSAKSIILLVMLVLSVFFASSMALGAPHFFPGEINVNGLETQQQQAGDDEVSQEPENIADDILLLDGETVLQAEPLPLESITVPPEPFMGAPSVVLAEAKPQLPQTGVGLPYSEAGCLLSIIGIIINSKIR